MKNKFLAIILTVSSIATAKDGINTVDVTSKTISSISKCSKYKLKGMCLWMEMKKAWLVSYPVFHQTLYVEHYRPDLVVSVFPEFKKHPWREMRFIQKGENQAGNIVARSLFKGAIDGGQIQGGFHNSNNIRFKEVTVTGHPGASIPFPGVLPSQANSMVPYYNSIRDVSLWRNPGTEMLIYPHYMIPGIKEVGQGLIYSWGSLFPRTGFVNQNDDAKAAAILALRALNIATTDSIHLSYNINRNNCGQYCDKPGPIEHRADVKFQMLYPLKQSSCVQLCDSLQPEWLDKARQDNGSYVWVVWRKYKGCKDAPGRRVACFGCH